MSDADYGFYVDQGLVLCLSVVLLTLSVMLLWRERKATSQRVTNLGYVIRRLVTVVLALIVVRYVDPSGINHLYPQMLRNVLLANAGAGSIIIVIYFVYNVVASRFESEAERTPKWIGALALVAALGTIAMLNIDQILTVVYDRRVYNAISYIGIGSLSFCLGLTVALSLWNLSFAVAQAVYIMQPSAQQAIRRKVRRMRILVAFSVLVGMGLIGPIMFLNGLSLYEDEGEPTSYQPDETEYHFGPDSLPTWFCLIIVSLATWYGWIDSPDEVEALLNPAVAPDPLLIQAGQHANGITRTGSRTGSPRSSSNHHNGANGHGIITTNNTTNGTHPHPIGQPRSPATPKRKPPSNAVAPSPGSPPSVVSTGSMNGQYQRL